MNFIRILMAVALIALASPAYALLPSGDAGGTEPAEAAAPTPLIEQAPEEGDDERIAERIEGIFGELPAFETVEVEVSEGVVSLSGTLPDADTIARAEAIAGRVSGVVTVENGIERDLSVEQNLSILGKASELIEGAFAGLPLFLVALAVALAIGTLGYLIAGLGFIWDRIAPNAFLGELIRSAIRFVFAVGGVVIALDMLGAGALLGAVLGGAGVVGIALGFAMRDTIENYVASLMLSLRQPFRPNDHVLIDDLEGRVIRLTSRATVLMTLEGNHLRIPNAQVFKAVILNYTRNPQRRFDFELGIDADDDPRAAMKLGGEVLRSLGFVLSDPAPAARISNVGDSNIAILFLGWIDQREADWFKSRSLAIAAVKDALEDAGFALPEPIYRLRFDGRTDPLPIGRSASVTEAKPADKPRAKADTQEDVRPESEISELVEAERRSDDEQAKDLLDTSRPVE
ncbi:mechanosensitive ion channel family protein [Erythrobacter sp. KY5]|uniref:mechanosensitive ion channel family protein n=1 Tax=Erythrobacter sp. KY5 TaxID=2011159 RepID=UPI001F409180|nr:mechanosensitive ion channel family protein [Erythrobacter sp. KY5]